MIGRLRQLSEPRLRQLAGIEKPQTPVERDILVQWVRKHHVTMRMAGLLLYCLGLTALCDSILVYIGPSTRDEVRKKMDERKKMS